LDTLFLTVPAFPHHYSNRGLSKNLTPKSKNLDNSKNGNFSLSTFIISSTPITYTNIIVGGTEKFELKQDK
jgi:hypothetical protein